MWLPTSGRPLTLPSAPPENQDPPSTVWGTGRPVREFLYVDDLAEACVLLMDLPGPLPGAPINIGTGRGTSIKELAEAIAGLLDYRGSIQFDASKPDGAPVKVLDSSRIHSLGWASRTPLQDGLRRTYEWYLSRN